MIKCSQCQFDNKDGAELCLNCGAPISQIVDDEDDFADVSDEATVLINPAAMQARIKSELESRSGSGSAPKQSPPASSPEPPKANAPVIPQQKDQQAPPPAASSSGDSSNKLTMILLSLIILIVLLIVGIVILVFLK